MKEFVARVELHGSKDERDYERLHGFMHEAGFFRVIEAAGGKYYSLPTAEYSHLSNGTCGEAMETAKAAAAKVGLKFSLVVVEAANVSIYGLSPVD